MVPSPIDDTATYSQTRVHSGGGAIGAKAGPALLVTIEVHVEVAAPGVLASSARVGRGGVDTKAGGRWRFRAADAGEALAFGAASVSVVFGPCFFI